ncbi:jg66, partial [Pararge aegeria aegeria]
PTCAASADDSPLEILRVKSPTLIPSQQGASPSTCGSDPDGREIIRQSLLKRGVPIISLEIVMASFSSKTLNQYNSYLKSWWLYCNNKGLSYCDSNVTQLIEFLTEKFNSGAGYSTLNSYRSALSILLGQEITCQDNVKRFFKGVYRKKPPAPKYDTTWDPNLVLNYLQNYYPNDLISLKDLSLKTITLIALASAQRMQTLSLMKIQNISFEEDKIKIKIDDLIKTSKPNAFQPLIVLPYIRENPKICPALCLKMYLDRTYTLRLQEDFLFISYQKPHKKIGTQTLSHWVKSILQKSGIDITLYGAHSTRHASTSAAHRAGVNLEIIRKAAGWTKDSNVFLKYYNKDLVTTDQTDFVDALF